MRPRFSARVSCVWFRVPGLDFSFGIWGLVFRLWDWISSLVFGLWDSGFEISFGYSSFGIRALVSRLWYSGFEIRASGFGFWHSGTGIRAMGSVLWDSGSGIRALSLGLWDWLWCYRRITRVRGVYCAPDFGSRRYRGTSLIINHLPLGPYRSLMPRVLGGFKGGGRFLMSEVPL